MILYPETNFIMGVATGRDAFANQLFSVPSNELRIVLPAVCVMEAYSAFEDERKRRNRIGQSYEEQAGQMRRDTTSIHAQSLLSHLKQATIDNSSLLNDVENRLHSTVRQLAERAEFIELTNTDIIANRDSPTLKDPTDDLILHLICRHARANPDEDKVFLSENIKDFDTEKGRLALTNANILFQFARAESFLGWYKALSSKKATAQKPLDT